MTTLADINNTLIEQSDVLRDNNTGIEKLTRTVGVFTRSFRQSALDNLEASREVSQGTSGAATIQQTQQNIQTDSPSGGGFLEFLGLGRLGTMLASGIGLAMVGGLFKSLLKKGIFGAAAVFLADEIGDWVRNATGSQLYGDLTEAGIVGAGVGSIFGPKGAIAGALITAVQSASTKLGKYIETETGNLKYDFNVLLGQTAQAVTGIAGAAGIGFMMGGPIGALIGGTVAAGLQLHDAMERYKNDPAFQKQVDDAKKKIEETLASIKDTFLNTINKYLDDFVTTDAEKKAVTDAMSQTTAGQKMLERERIAENQISTLGSLREKAEGSRDISELTAIAAEAGVNISNMSKDPMLLAVGIYQAIMKRQDELKESLKDVRIERKNLERQLSIKQTTSGESSTRIDSRIAAISAQLNNPNVVGDQKTILESQLIALRKEKALLEKSVTNNGATLTNAIRDMRGPDAGYINAVDASTTNNIGSASTTLVGSGTSTMDINNPNFMRAMEARLVGR
jgi:hypothetical protein